MPRSTQSAHPADAAPSRSAARFSRRSLLLSALLAGGGATALAACGSTTGSLAGAAALTSVDGSIERTKASSLWDPSVLHTIDLTIDAAELSAMLEAFLASSDKEWITGTAVIDGQSFENVGFTLKGNSSLEGITADTDPATLPWRIRLDKNVEGQSLDGAADIVVRDSTTASALNEAVALDMLAKAGLASQLSSPASLTVNGGTAQLRLILEFLDTAWMTSVFSADGTLFKAEAGGDYSYRGDTAEDYDGVFDVEGGEENYAPLAAFLKFVNEADDSAFASELSEHLDVDAFARYLAFEDLIGNFDDIDGPGNNSYLYYGPDAGTMTVVAWDHNMAFGVGPGGGGQGGGRGPGGMGGTQDGQRGAPPAGAMPGGAMPGGSAPDGAAAPSDAGGAAPAAGAQGAGQAAGQGGAGRGGGMGGKNILATRFAADATFSALVTEQAATLRTDLVDSGAAKAIVEARAKVLTDAASALISADYVQSDADAILAALDGTSTSASAGQPGGAGTGAGVGTGASDGGS